MKRLILLLILTGLIFSQNVQAADNEIAGKIIRLKGSVIATLNDVSRSLITGDEIMVKDVISTGSDGIVEIKMIDDSVLTLGAATSFMIDDYGLEGENSSAAMKLFYGVLNGVSGSIAKVGSKGMVFDTPVATIGIRGTKFWVGQLDGVFNVAHWSGGGVSVKNNAGEVFLKDNNVGTQITNTMTPPTPPKDWGKDKKARALDLVAF